MLQEYEPIMKLHAATKIMIMMFDGALFSHINFKNTEKKINIMLQDYKLCCWLLLLLFMHL